jgi:serine/threonine-protein kinase
VAFRVGNDLKRVSVDGGAVRTIGAIGELALPGSWSAEDTILYTGEDGVYELPANGGAPQRLTRSDRQAGERGHRFPQLLPGRRGVLLATPKGSSVLWSESLIVAQPLDGGERKILIEGGSDPRYLPSGHIAFARRGALWAAPFDAARLEVVGAPVIVVEDIMHAEAGRNSGLNTGTAQFSVSASGALAYVPGGVFPEDEFSLTWVDGSGKAEPLSLPPAQYVHPRISPDGRRLAYVTGTAGLGTGQIWVYDIAREVPVRLAGAGDAFAPVWSPDGTRLAFSRVGGGLYWTYADGRGSPQLIGSTDGTFGVLMQPSSWSSGDVLAFVGPAGPRAPQAIWTVRMDGASEPALFTSTESVAARHPVFSPDGRWVAYSASEPGGAGPSDVYVRPFPEGAPLQRISLEGGREPTWSGDGRQLFYTVPVGLRQGNRPMMVVDVATEPVFTPSRARLLFEGNYGGTDPVRNYDVAPDGERFLMVQPLEAAQEPVTSIELVLNWLTELEQRVPAP